MELKKKKRPQTWAPPNGSRGGRKTVFLLAPDPQKGTHVTFHVPFRLLSKLKRTRRRNPVTGGRGFGGLLSFKGDPPRGKPCYIWVWLKIQEGQTAGFGPCFHLPGFHFATGFLSHSHLSSSMSPKRRSLWHPQKDLRIGELAMPPNRRARKKACARYPSRKNN